VYAFQLDEKKLKFEAVCSFTTTTPSNTVQWIHERVHPILARVKGKRLIKIVDLNHSSQTRIELYQNKMNPTYPQLSN